MTPAAEARYLRRLADEIGSDTHIGRLARLIARAVLIGYAARIERGTARVSHGKVA